MMMVKVKSEERENKSKMLQRTGMINNVGKVFTELTGSISSWLKVWCVKLEYLSSNSASTKLGVLGGNNLAFCYELNVCVLPKFMC